MAFLLSLIAVRRVEAAVSCSSLPSPVYVEGTSAVKPLLALSGRNRAGVITPVFMGTGGCQALSDFAASNPIVGTASFWDSTGLEQTCNLDVGTQANVVVSDLFAAVCGVTLPAGTTELQGPVETYSFVVPAASSQTVISASAAYLVYGFGAASHLVSPWTSPTSIFARTAAAGPQQTLALAIGVPAGSFMGTAQNSSAGMLSAVSAAVTPEATIGFLGADLADGNRSTVRSLAFKAFGASCGFLPDSGASAFDKRNVRDGHYQLWSPLHVFTPSAAGPGAQTIVGDLVGFDQQTLNAVIAGHLIPQCAMRVQRTSELGPLSLRSTAGNSPSSPTVCGCYFENQVTGSTSCTPCVNGGCAGGKVCDLGFCE